MPRVLSSRGLPIAVTPACAARGSNPVPRIKSPVHHRSCLQRLEPHAGIEPAFPAWKAGTLAVVLVRRGDSGWDRTNGLLGFNQALIPTELQSHQSGSRDSNPVHPGPKPGALTLTLHPVAWTAPDSNREHPACKAGALPLGASSPWAAAGKAAAGTSDAHAVQVSSCEHIPPEGWCSAGVEGIEPSLPALETGGVTVRYTPMCQEKQTARRVSPASGFQLCPASTRKPPRWRHSSRAG